MRRLNKFISYVLIVCSILSFFPRDAFAGSPDYAHPDFESHRFILNNPGGKKTILHKFKFGDQPSEVLYEFGDGIQTYEAPYEFPPANTGMFSEINGINNTTNLPLNSEYLNREFNIFVSSKNFTGSQVALVGVKLTDESQASSLNTDVGNYQILGVYAFAMVIGSGEVQGNDYACPNKLWGKENLVPAGAGVASRAGSRDLAGSICLYSLSAFQNGETNSAITSPTGNPSYVKYANALNDSLQAHSWGSVFGSQMTDMTPTADKVTSCKDDNLVGPINTSYREYIDTFINEIVSEADTPDKQKLVKEFIAENGVHISDSEDKELFQDYYSDKDPTEYANKFMDDEMQGKFFSLVSKVNSDDASMQIYNQLTWFETIWGSELVKAAQAAGGYQAAATGAKFAYAKGAAFGVKVINGMSAVKNGTTGSGLLVRVGTFLMGSGEAAGAGATTGALITASIVAIIALVVIAAILAAYNKMKKDLAKSFFHSGLTIWYAMHYIEANKQNQECTGLWNKYKSQQKVYDYVMALGGATKDDVKSTTAGFADALGETSRCSMYKPERPWDYKKQISLAFCALGLMLEDLANKFMQSAIATLSKSIGFTKE